MERSTKLISDETILKAVAATDFTTYSVLDEEHCVSRGKARSAIRSFITYFNDLYEHEEASIFDAAKCLDACPPMSDEAHGEAAIRAFIERLEKNGPSLPECLL